MTLSRSQGARQAPRRGSAGYRPTAGLQVVWFFFKLHVNYVTPLERGWEAGKNGKTLEEGATLGDTGLGPVSCHECIPGLQPQKPQASPQASEEKSPLIKKCCHPKSVRDGFIHFPDILMVSPLFAGR